MASLISQFLLYEDTKLDFMEHKLYAAVANKDVLALCELFELLVVRADLSKTIYCVIDSISDFEGTWSAEILDVVRYLRRLVDLQRQGPAFKLLMTSANRTQGLVNMVDQSAGEHVSLRAGNTPGRATRSRLSDNLQRPALMSSPSRGSSSIFPQSGAEAQWEYSYNRNQRRGL